MKPKITCLAEPVVFELGGKRYISPVKEIGWLEILPGQTLEDFEIIKPTALANKILPLKAPVPSPTPPPGPVWETTVKSMTKNERYLIVMRGDGHFKCECMGYRFRATCKHIDQVKAHIIERFKKNPVFGEGVDLSINAPEEQILHLFAVIGPNKRQAWWG